VPEISARLGTRENRGTKLPQWTQRKARVSPTEGFGTPTLEKPHDLQLMRRKMWHLRTWKLAAVLVRFRACTSVSPRWLGRCRGRFDAQVADLLIEPCWLLPCSSQPLLYMFSIALVPVVKYLNGLEMGGCRQCTAVNARLAPTHNAPKR